MHYHSLQFFLLCLLQQLTLTYFEAVLDVST